MTADTAQQDDLLAQLHAIQRSLPRTDPAVESTTPTRPSDFRLSPAPHAKASVPDRYGITLSDLSHYIKDAPDAPTSDLPDEDDLSDLDEFAAKFSPEEDHAPRRRSRKNTGRHLRRSPRPRRVALGIGAVSAAVALGATGAAMTSPAQAGDTTPPVTIDADLPDDLKEGTTLVIIEDGRRVTVSVNDIND